MSVASLATKLAAYSKSYYLGKPAVSDDEFDALKEKLKRADPDHPFLKKVGAPPAAGSRKITHAVRLGSLDNCFTPDDIKAWVDRVLKASADWAKPPQWVVVQPKLDGCTVNLSYRNGVLTTAAMRGDGYVGEDVTANARKAKGVPWAIPFTANIDVRCEAVITKTDFDIYFKPNGDANARNSATGTMRRSDGALAERVTLRAFDAQFVDKTVSDADRAVLSTEFQTIESLRSWGFNVAETEKVRLDVQSIVTAWKAHLADRETKDCLVDGCVVKVNNKNAQQALGWSSTCPVGAFAGKWRGQMVADTEIVGLLNSVGHTGIITPVAILKPVECGGTTVSKASLMNWDEVARICGKRKLGNGAKVRIEKSGDIIPRVIEVLADAKVAFERPTNCPACNAEAYEDGPRQVCTNPDCPAVTFRKVLNWVKGRNILYFGETTIDKLMAMNGPLATIADIYRLTEKQIANAAGSHITAAKIVDQINASKTCTPTQLLGNIGIPGIGESEADKVFTMLGQPAASSDIIDYEEADLAKAIGPVKAAKLRRGLDKYGDLINDLWTLLTVAAPKSKAVDGGTKAWNGKTFCITGATEIPRNTLVKIIEGAGGIWKSSVVNGLDFLIMADANSTSNKATAARKKGIAVIDEQRALDMADYK